MSQLTTFPAAFVTTYHPIAGWKAVMMTLDHEFGQHTPWDTSYFAYATKEEAVIDAKCWAEAEEIPYID